MVRSNCGLISSTQLLKSARLLVCASERARASRPIWLSEAIASLSVSSPVVAVSGPLVSTRRRRGSTRPPTRIPHATTGATARRRQGTPPASTRGAPSAASPRRRQLRWSVDGVLVCATLVGHPGLRRHRGNHRREELAAWAGDGSADEKSSSGAILVRVAAPRRM